MVWCGVVWCGVVGGVCVCVCENKAAAGGGVFLGLVCAVARGLTRECPPPPCYFYFAVLSLRSVTPFSI